MKAIVLTHPWAYLVAYGIKTLETRTWTTRYRGPLAMIASKNFDQKGEEMLKRSGIRLPMPHDYVFGAVLSTHVLRDVFLYTEEHVAQGLFPFNPNERRFAWDLIDRKLLTKPIRVKGQLGIFDLPDGLLEDAFGRLIAPVHSASAVPANESS